MSLVPLGLPVASIVPPPYELSGMGIWELGEPTECPQRRAS